MSFVKGTQGKESLQTLVISSVQFSSVEWYPLSKYEGIQAIRDTLNSSSSRIATRTYYNYLSVFNSYTQSTTLYLMASTTYRQKDLRWAQNAHRHMLIYLWVRLKNNIYIPGSCHQTLNISEILRWFVLQWITKISRSPSHNKVWIQNIWNRGKRLGHNYIQGFQQESSHKSFHKTNW